MTALPSTRLLWFGVLGGALAWATQFVANLAFGFAQCNDPAARWRLPVHGWEIGLSAAAAIVGLAATTVSLRIYRQTHDVEGAADHERRGLGHPPPLGRVNFLATVGLLVNFLSLAIVVMTAVGAPLLTVCQQS